MNNGKAILAAILIGALPISALAQDHSHSGGTSPYAGLQTRQIKSLSDQDIEELRRGGGWGLALPAELNGRPGPKHLLELSEEIGLSQEQLTRIEAMYETMRAEAIAAGERFIAAEAALSKAFGHADLGEEHLRELLEEAAAARADLRFIHLSQHLATPAVLSSEQIKKYNVLRGYGDDPCTNVPEGHDATLWRKHNGCD